MTGCADRLAAALGPVAARCPGRLSVAVQPCGAGRPTVFGTDAFETASVVKTGILAALLLQSQDTGRRLSGRERELAAVMIERSDNPAATELWNAIGGGDGFEAAAGRLGLRETVADERGRWGLTRTTAADQLALLRAVYGSPREAMGGAAGSGAGGHGAGGGESLGGGVGVRSALRAGSRLCVRRRMARIVAGQDWGVSAAADTTAGLGLKNGWLPRGESRRWVVNSVGRVPAGGRGHLLAVLSDGHASRAEGIAVVERAARLALAALVADSTGAAGELGPAGE